MKPHPRNLPILLTLTGALGLAVARPATAQTFRTLYSFTPLSNPYPGTNSDGGYPLANLVSSGYTLFGTASLGGTNAAGTVFKVNMDGTDFRVLHTFTAKYWNFTVDHYTNGDGATPRALILSSNSLYGTASQGGSGGAGTLFRMNTDGTGFTNLYSFTAAPYGINSDGAGPVGLVLSGDILYGIMSGGGNSGNCAVIAINTDGTGFTNLHSFTATSGSTCPGCTNSDGANPQPQLGLSSNTLYGTTISGGLSGNGTVFAITTDGTGFTNLHSFSALGGLYGDANTDGAWPQGTGTLVLSGNTLYGTAAGGGSYGHGTTFAINIEDMSFGTLHAFNYTTDGDGPTGGLILSSNVLYGAASRGGLSGSGNGTVFAMSPDGTRFTLLHSFTPNPSPYDTNSDGALPNGLILSGNTLYGTTEGGGSSQGTVFSILLPPRLTIVPAGANVILTWPTNYSGYTLQSTTDLGPSAVWTTNLPPPVIVNGQNTVTNPISATQQFFRLSR